MDPDIYKLNPAWPPSESDCRSSGCEFDPARSHTFLEIHLEMLSGYKRK